MYKKFPCFLIRKHLIQATFLKLIELIVVLMVKLRHFNEALKPPYDPPSTTANASFHINLDIEKHVTILMDNNTQIIKIIIACTNDILHFLF